MNERERIIKLLKNWLRYLEKPEYAKRNDALIAEYKEDIIRGIRN